MWAERGSGRGYGRGGDARVWHHKRLLHSLARRRTRTYVVHDRLLRSRGVACKDAASARSLDRAEALKLLGLHRDLLAETDLAGGATDERDTVRVERLVDRGRARSRASHRDARLLGLLGDRRVVTLAEALDDRRLHGELDKVKREEPDDVLKEAPRKHTEHRTQSKVSLLTQTQTIPIQAPEML